MSLGTLFDIRSKRRGYVSKPFTGCVRSRAALWAIVILVIAGLFRPGSMNAGGGVCILKTKALRPYDMVEKAFCREVKGKPTTYDMEAQMGKGKVSFAEILSQKPACIHVIGTHAARLASSERVSIPVIFSMILDPDDLGGIQGLVAGCFALPSPHELFESFKRIKPDAKRISVVYDQKWTGFIIARGLVAAREQGLELVAEAVKNPKDAMNALDVQARTTDAIWMLPDPTVLSSKGMRHMLMLSFRRKIPLLATSEKHIIKGAFLALRMDYNEIGKQAARMANQILNSGRIEGYNYAFAENNRIVLNLNSAEKLGIKIPQEILDEALIFKR